MASKRCLKVFGTSNCPRELSKPFLNNFSHFLKIDFGTFGKPIFTSALLKRFGGLLEPPLSMRETQDDNKKICRIDFLLKAYFLRKLILNVLRAKKQQNQSKCS